jgi:hypothetical protein
MISKKMQIGLLSIAIGGSLFLIIARLWILALFVVRYQLDVQINNYFDSNCHVNLSIKSKLGNSSCKLPAWQKTTMNIIQSEITYYLLPLLISGGTGYVITKKYIVKSN